MSKRMKVLWIVIGALFVVGIVLTAIGFALGGSGYTWIDRNGLHFGNREQVSVELADSNVEPFENIDISLLGADVELIVGTDYGYEFTYLGALEPSIEVNNGTLKVEEDDNSWYFNIFGIWNFTYQHSKLKVFVPSEALLNEVSLQTASGNTVFEGDNVVIKDLEYISASGDITMSDITLEQLRVDVASGDVKLTNVAAQDATITMVSGELTYKGASLDSLVLDMISGTARLSGSVKNDLVLQMVSGDVDFDLEGSEDDYSFSFNKVSGDIKINGREVNNSSLPSSSSYNTQGDRRGHIQVDTTSGSVNINFG